MLQKQILLIIMCYIGLNGSAQTQFPTYKPLPIIPPTTFQLPQEPSFLEQYDANRRQQLEMDILKEQRDLLRKLNGNSNTDNSANTRISLRLSGINVSDLELNLKKDWDRFNQRSYLTIDASRNEVNLYMPEMNVNESRNILNFSTEGEEDYTISTFRFREDEFMSILSIQGEETLFVILGKYGEKELVVLQSTL